LFVFNGTFLDQLHGNFPLRFVVVGKTDFPISARAQFAGDFESVFDVLFGWVRSSQGLATCRPKRMA
jgi:hypothetical protein